MLATYCVIVNIYFNIVICGVVNDDIISDDIIISDDHVRTTDDSTEQQLLKEKLSNIILENNLLRDEVKLLNSELAEVNKRMKEMQECMY